MQDEERFRKLYQENYTLLSNILYSYLKNREDMEDCLHDVMLYAYESFEQYKDYDNPAKWLILTGKNYARNYSRRKRQKIIHENANTDLLSDCGFEENVIEEILYQKYLYTGVLEKTLAQLNFREMQLYELKYIQKMPNRKVSEVLNLAEGSVKVMNTRLKKKIIKILKKEMRKAERKN